MTLNSHRSFNQEMGDTCAVIISVKKVEINMDVTLASPFFNTGAWIADTWNLNGTLCSNGRTAGIRSGEGRFAEINSPSAIFSQSAVDQTQVRISEAANNDRPDMKTHGKAAQGTYMLRRVWV